MSHTKGPLVVCIENGVPCIRPGDHKAQGHSMGYAPIAKVTGDRRIGGQLENARRIVACVNACAGLNTDLLENIAMTGGLVERFSLINQTERQRDELLTALKAIHTLRPLGKDSSEYALTVESLAREAVAKVEAV